MLSMSTVAELELTSAGVDRVWGAKHKRTFDTSGTSHVLNTREDKDTESPFSIQTPFRLGFPSIFFILY